MMLLGACSSDNWEPGEADNPTMGVFFTSLEKYSVTVEADDPHVFTVELGRIDASTEASVPLKVISCPEGVVVPSAVEFEAGAETATIEIDVNDMALKSTGDIVLEVDPAYAAVYGAGTSQMSMTVTIAGGWVVLADDVEITCYINTSYPALKAELWVLEGSNRFKIPDFLGSGTDLVFYLSSTTSSYPVMFPFTNYKYYYELWSSYEDDEDYPWYFYDTEKAKYPSIWTPEGWPKSIEYVTFYLYDGDDKASYINLSTGYATMESYIDFADGSGTWEYFEFSFTTKFDPFAAQ